MVSPGFLLDHHLHSWGCDATLQNTNCFGLGSGTHLISKLVFQAASAWDLASLLNSQTVENVPSDNSLTLKKYCKIKQQIESSPLALEPQREAKEL